MNTDNSIASFWHAYTANEKATKLLPRRGEPLALGPMADAVNADESPDNPILEVVEYHP